MSPEILSPEIFPEYALPGLILFMAWVTSSVVIRVVLLSCVLWGCIYADRLRGGTRARVGQLQRLRKRLTQGIGRKEE